MHASFLTRLNITSTRWRHHLGQSLTLSSRTLFVPIKELRSKCAQKPGKDLIYSAGTISRSEFKKKVPVQTSVELTPQYRILFFKKNLFEQLSVCLLNTDDRTSILGGAVQGCDRAYKLEPRNLTIHSALQFRQIIQKMRYENSFIIGKFIFN